MERDEWNQKLVLAKVKEEEKHHNLESKHQEEIDHHKQQVASLLHDLQLLKDEMHDISRRSNEEQIRQSDYVKKTLDEQKKGFLEEFKQITKATISETGMVKANFDMQIQAVESNYKVHCFSANKYTS